MIPLRDDNPAFLTPYVTLALIGACVAVFLLELGVGDRGTEFIIYRYGMIPAVLVGDAQHPDGLDVPPPVVTLFSSMFLHGGWGHLLGNMLYLWIFGNNVEDRFGHLGYLAFYLVSGLAAAVAQIIPDPHSLMPMVGASGAIAGVLGAYLVLFPHARVLVLIPFLFMRTYVRAVWVLGVWIAFQLVAALGGPSVEGGVAWWAHIGGFAAGFLIALPFRSRPFGRRRGPWD